MRWRLILTLGALAWTGAAASLARGATAIEPPLAVWMRAPDVRGRQFDLHRLRGQVVVITFASRETMEESRRIHRRLSALVEPGHIAVVAVINLRSVPRFALGYAHRRVAEAVADSRLLHVLDDRGNLWRSFSVEGADMLIIDRGGLLRYRFRGQEDVDEVIRSARSLR